MAQGQRLICAAADLAEAGTGIRFQLRREGREVPAFVIRWRGQVRAYLNRCGHIPVELDWQPEFSLELGLEDTLRWLIDAGHLQGELTAR